MSKKGAPYLLWIFIFSGAGGCAGTQPQTAADAPPTPMEDVRSEVEKRPRGGVDPSRFTPYFEGNHGGEAAAALRAENYEKARAGFLALAESLPSSSVLTLRARFVASVCSHRSGDHETAMRELPLFIERLPLLADHARYLASVSAFRAHEFERAIELSRAVTPLSPLRDDAELIIGDALRSLGRFDEMETLYRGYMHQHRGGPRLAEATYKLAEAIERSLTPQSDIAKVHEAIRWYRRVRYRYPRSEWASRAAVQIHELATRLPESERAAVTSLSADEQLERAQAVARLHRHKQAMREFSKVLELTDPDGPIGCQARLGLGRAAYNGRKRQRAIEVLSETAAHCDEPDIRAWSLYLAARSSTSSGEERQAMEFYEQLERDHPRHRLADDSRLRRAQAALRMGETKEFSRLIRELPLVYPEGDMRCSAQWQLGWKTYRDGDYQEALKLFQQGDALCDAPEEGAGGRERYWAGRTLQKLGRNEEAKRAYLAVIEEHPLSYYMILAAERLEELAPQELAAQLRRISSSETDESAAEWRFDPRALQERTAFVRGIELHRLGLAEMARIEFAAADKELEDAQELRWLSALLHHKVEAYAVSHWIARRDLTHWRESYPVGSNEKYWHIAFPCGFEKLVRDESANESVPAELLWAVMREESGFSPTVESYANAVGLLQLLPATASRFAKGLRADRAGLKQPENNIPIAARYLSWLMKRNESSLILAVASYNAGEGSVARWRHQDPDLELDEALESFTYGQTRQYTRRVLSSYGSYHYLYGNGRIPHLLGSGSLGSPEEERTPAPTEQ